MTSFTRTAALVAITGVSFLGTVSLMSADDAEPSGPTAKLDRAALSELKEIAAEKMQRLQEELVAELITRNPQIQWSGCAAEEAAVAIAQANYDAADDTLADAQDALNECQNGSSGP